MGSIGTFGSYNIARLGIFAAQGGLNVTGNNIANINTEGYTRQRLNQSALRTGGADRYTASSSYGSGAGVYCDGTSQTRDLYLDIRYRSEAASVGASDTWLAGLNDIAAIMDEVGDGQGDGIIEAQFSKLIDTLQNLSVYTGQEEYEVQVRSAAQTLVSLFNSYSTQLQTIHDNTDKEIKQEVIDANSILEQIRTLNASIRKSELHGDNALELQDERNMLLDQLAEYMDIDVIYDKEEIGAGLSVTKLVVKLANSNPDPTVHSDETTLIDGVYARQLELSEDGNYDAKLTNLTNSVGAVYTNTTTDVTALTTLPAGVTLNTPATTVSELSGFRTKITTTYEEITKPQQDANGNPVLDGNGNPVTTFVGYRKTVITEKTSIETSLDDNDLYGSIQSLRELLTEEGEFASNADLAKDEDAATKRGIPFYQQALDLLANKMADIFNSSNTQGTAAKAGVLFSNSGDTDDGTGITAGNISISASWATGAVGVVNSFQTGAGSTANDNILELIAKMDADHDFDPTALFNATDPNKPASTQFFSGSFQEMFSNIGSILGNDQSYTSTMLDTYHASAVDLDASRDNVSSVDLNDEAANLMMYQSAYSAACRVMTTIDEALNKLINGI